ncbi:MAG: sodium-independent anion transporter, partial [Gammaproteobacteria bacterium]
TEHFRNVQRHDVETFDNLLSIRVDESLYFANTHYLEELVFKLVSERPDLEHVILLCGAVNHIDLSALVSLEKLNQTLGALGVKLHLSEVKGPIMDRLSRTEFFNTLSGKSFDYHNQAVESLRQH